MNTTMNKPCGEVRPQQAQPARKARPRLYRSSTQQAATSTLEAGKPLKPHAPSPKEALPLAQQRDAAALETTYQLARPPCHAPRFRMNRDPLRPPDPARQAVLKLFRTL